VAVHIAPDGKSGALVEVNCETDFVAKNAEFLEFSGTLATLVTSQLPGDVEALSRLPLKGAPVEEARKALVGKIGENVTVRRFPSNLIEFQDRFPDARQRLDIYHGDEHLWAVAHELYGPGTPEAREWVAPLLTQVRNDDSRGVIHSLKELQPSLSQALQKKVQTQIEYFQNHENRMQYREIIRARKAVAQGKATAAQQIKANEPLGSGAIESTCRQYQCRFKRTGQFWSTAGDEALMCLETFWRNGRWHELYPHAKLTSPSLN